MAKKKSRANQLMEMMPFTQSDWVIRNLSFIFFLGLLGFIHIANARYAESKLREIQTLQKEIQKLNWEYMALKSELMQKSTQSEVKKEAERRKLGLQEPQHAPEKIVVTKKNYQ